MHEVNLRAVPVSHHVMLESVDEAVALLGELGPRARLVAGGTDLLIELQRRAHPDVTTLLDLTTVPGLGDIEDLGDKVRIGALVTHNQVAASELCRRTLTPLAQACREVGAPALRNRATVVGNVVTASPANDTIGPLRALDAWLTISGPEGQRHVPLADFHTGVRRTVLSPAEVVTHLVVRKLGPGRSAVFVKAGLRTAQAISLVNATVLMERYNGRVGDIRILLGAVAPTIVSALGAEEHLRGETPDVHRIEEAALMAAAGVTPIDDIRASAAHRRRLLRVVVRRALDALVDEADTDDSVPVLLSPTGTAHVPGGAPLSISVNDRSTPLADSDGVMLLDWLRDQAGTPGVKEGCAEGECGACIVLVDGTAVLSCLTPATAVAGRFITTVEGLARESGLHPLQQAFIDTGAVQCGFCIPGFLVAGAALLAERPVADDDAITEGLGGNLCRCTGYTKIMEAVRAAGSERL
jgi:xanthine dehydrogenase iron-sulfur cluster and FAD-binding subunit A